MRALHKQSIPEVRDAALQHFGDGGELACCGVSSQPALCCAVEARSGTSIIDLLLDMKADINATNAKGQTALAALSALSLAPQWGVPLSGMPFISMCSDADERLSGIPEDSLGADHPAETLRPAHGPQGPEVELATHLLSKGADPTIPDARGATPAQRAPSARNGQLACLLRHYRDVQACAAFRQIATQRGLYQSLAHDVDQYLVPRQIWEHFALLGHAFRIGRCGR